MGDGGRAGKSLAEAAAQSGAATRQEQLAQDGTTEKEAEEMTTTDYIDAALGFLKGLGPLLMVLSALGLADKILSFLFHIIRQARGVFK